jgi:spore germination protein KC
VIQPADSETSTPKAKVLKESGNSVEDCLKRLVNAATKELQFSHCKLILFSDEIATQGISDLVDYFLRDPEYRSDLFLAVVSGSQASEMLSTGEKESRISSYDYAAVIENSYTETGSVVPTRLYQFPMDGDLSILPVFKKSNDQFSVLESQGFRKGKKCAAFDLKFTQSVLLVSGEYKQGELLLYTDDGTEVPCQIKAVNTKKKIEKENPLTVSVTIYCDILLTTLPEGFDISTEEKMNEAESEVARLLTKKLHQDWEKSVSGNFSDIFGLETYVYRHAPKKFENLNGTKVELNPKCDVQLANFGVSNERIYE